MASGCPLQLITLCFFTAGCWVFATRPLVETKLLRGTNYVFRDNEVGSIRFGLNLTDCPPGRPALPNTFPAKSDDDNITSNTSARWTKAANVDDRCTCCYSSANKCLRFEETAWELSHWLSGTQCQVTVPRQVRGQCDVTETRSMTRAVAVTCGMTRRMTAKDNGRWYLYGAAQNRTFTVLVLKEKSNETHQATHQANQQTVSETRVAGTSLSVALSFTLPVETRELSARMAVGVTTQNPPTTDITSHVSVAVILLVLIILLFISWRVKPSRRLK